jgi:hypothetical protein
MISGSVALAPVQFVDSQLAGVWRDCPSTASRSAARCYAAELQFVVGVDGVPEMETARVVTTTNPSFAEAVLASVGQWRYAPARRDSVAVRQIVRERRAISIVVAPVSSADRPPAPAPRC